MNKKIILKISLKVISLLYIIGYIFFSVPIFYCRNESGSLSRLLMIISFIIISRKEKLVDKEKKYEKTFKILQILGNIITGIFILVYVLLEIETRFY